ncbi:alpha/beta fold hydrolase [Nocardioides sp. B-3]|uniref:alpha/beta fold hydrolase n=1 Tax=Nocardioides sp. B-3 TaxID=2895565 RepID=UPI002152C23F|nr:alpha/beta hydrolase [Nocardioides sp. B-3]UUZ58232.1 alpha/beta hydrolase [Nocardioides sp. B-3]
MTTWRDTPTKTITIGGTSFAYRELGTPGGIPVVFLHHFTAVLDDWDPRVLDGVAAKRHVIAFDNRGVGSTDSKVPNDLEQMGADAIAFIEALGHDKVDLFGFSLGGSRRPDGRAASSRLRCGGWCSLAPVRAVAAASGRCPSSWAGRTQRRSPPARTRGTSSSSRATRKARRPRTSTSRGSPSAPGTAAGPSPAGRPRPSFAPSPLAACMRPTTSWPSRCQSRSPTVTTT